jgi:hypothetical protein
MKHLISCFYTLSLPALLFFASPLKAQDYPIDENTKLISYSEVVKEDNINKDLLYRRLLTWANAFYKNPREAIREQNDATHDVLCVHRFKIYNIPAKGPKTDAGMVEYRMRVWCKDGKYKYDVTGINWKQTSNYPVERWLDKKAPGYKAEYESYLKQMDEEIKKVIESLTEGMSKGGASPNTDW